MTGAVASTGPFGHPLRSGARAGICAVLLNPCAQSSTARTRCRARPWRWPGGVARLTACDRGAHGPHPVVLVHRAKQDVLSSDLAMSERHSFALGTLECRVCRHSRRDRAKSRPFTAPDDLHEASSDSLFTNAGRLKCSACALGHGQQSQQQMLGLD